VILAPAPSPQHPAGQAAVASVWGGDPHGTPPCGARLGAATEAWGERASFGKLQVVQVAGAAVPPPSRRLRSWLSKLHGAVRNPILFPYVDARRSQTKSKRESSQPCEPPAKETQALLIS